MILTKNQAAKAVGKFKEKLHQSFGEKITLYLFGSVARGDFGPESDIDVLVLFNGQLTRDIEKAIMQEAFHIELEDDVVFGLMIEALSSWQTPLSKVTPIHKVIDEEGVLV